MATKIITKNSSTTTAIPTAADLVQGELAVNVTDKRLFTENSAGAIVELGTNPSTIDINAGTIDGTVIGGTTAAAGSFTTLGATGAATFSGNVSINGATTPFGSLAILSDSGANAVEIRTRATFNDYAFINFNSTDGSEALGALGVHRTAAATASLIFYSNDGTAGVNEAGRFDASGTLLVGKTGSSFNAVGSEIRSTGVVIGTVDGAAGLIANRLNSDGDLVQLSKDGTTVGSIGTQGGAPYISGPLAGGVKFSYLTSTNATIFPVTTTGAAADGLHDLGYAGSRFRNLYLTGTVNAGAALFSNASGGNVAQFTNTTSADLNINLTSGVTLLSPSTGILAFGTSSTERMRLDASGNLTVSNGDIYAAKSNGNSILYLETNTTTNAAGINCTSSGQTWLAGNNFGASDGRFSIYNSTTNAERFSIPAAGGGIISTTDSASFSIDARQTGGNGYGILSRFSVAGLGYMYAAYLDSPGAYKFYVTTAGAVYGNGTYGTISDIKLKENIAAANSQWDDIKAVQLKNYSLIADNLDHADQLGVIAQDLEASGMGKLIQVLDDIDGDGESLGTVTKHVKYSILHLKALGALQEAMTRIETLEARLKALEGA